MAAIMNEDGSVTVPIAVAQPGLYGDGAATLRPGEDGYDQAAATSIRAQDHPLLSSNDPVRSAELAALFATWERASA
jgi:hypothetical protein